MSQTCVFLPPAACAEVDAELLVQRVHGARREPMPFARAVAAKDESWTLVLPVEAVTACAVQLPTQKARWLRQALPFAVEELLAEDVEQFHLALGEPLADGRHRVFAVRRRLEAVMPFVPAELLDAMALGVAADSAAPMLPGSPDQVFRAPDIERGVRAAEQEIDGFRRDNRHRMPRSEDPFIY